MDSCLEHLDLNLHSRADGSDRRVWHFNVAFVGSCRAGKTKLLQRFVDSQFSDIYSETAETSFVSKSVSIGRHHVVFQCWDTPGSKRSSGSLDGRLVQLHAVFIVFDGSRDAVADLDHWHHLAIAAAGSSGPTTTTTASPLLVLVANKTDLGCHQGSMTRARDLANGSAGGGLVFALSILTDEENLEVDAMMLEVGKALTERHSWEAAAAAAMASAAAAAAAALPLDTPCPTPSTVSLTTPQVAGDQQSAATSVATAAVVAATSAADAACGDGASLASSGKSVGSSSGSGGGSQTWWHRICCCFQRW